VSCFYPVTAYRSRAGRSEKGGWPIVFNVADGYCDLPVQIPCGKCIGCRLDKTAQWAMRIMCEADMHEKNCYLTLTYEEDSLNEKSSLQKKDVQGFWKRLRNDLSVLYGNSPDYKSVRYFSAGEYGDLRKRPHYHAALFGEDFSSDRIPWQQGVKDILYRSPTLEKAWGKGICTIQELNHESALYIAKYVVKRLSGERESEYEGKQPEFALMSRRPGLAADWLKKYMNDVKGVDGVVIKNGKIVRPGRFFDSKIEAVDPKHMLKVKAERRKKIDPEQDTYRRLEAREKLKKHQIKWKRRNYEK